MKKTGLKGSRNQGIRLSALFCILTSVFCILSLTGCGAGNNPVSTLAPAQEALKAIEPVSVTGSVELPTGTNLKPEELKVSAGVVDTQPVSADGSFTVNLNKNATQLVFVKDKNDKPVFISLQVTPDSNTKVTFNAETTAKALIFMNPFILEIDPTLAKQTLATIDSLPETQEFITLFKTKFSKDASVLTSSDEELKAFLKKVLDAFYKKTYPSKEKIEPPVGTPYPSDPNTKSGISMLLSSTSDTVKYDIKITNYKKRFLTAYLENAENGQLLKERIIIRSKGGLWGLWGETYGTFSSWDNKATPEAKLKIYGFALEAGSLGGDKTNGDRMTEPVVLTFVFDFSLKLLFAALGIASTGANDVVAQSLIEVTGNMLTDYEFVSGVNSALKDDPLGKLLPLITKKFLEELMSDTGKLILERILVAVGAKVTVDVATGGVSLLVNLVDLSLVAGDIVVLGWDILNSKAMETFSMKNEAILESITIYVVQSTQVLEVGQTLSFKATGDFDDSSQRDITSQMIWKKSCDDSIAEFPLTSGDITLKGNAYGECKIWAESGSIKHNEITIRVDNPPTVALSADKTSGTAPLTVTFTATATDSDPGAYITKYAWDFNGDGTIDKEDKTSNSPVTATYTYTAAGSYIASVNAYDEWGLYKQAKVQIDVTSGSGNQAPSATLSADKTTGAAPLAVTFTVGYTDPEGAAGMYSLNFGDSTTAATGSINSGATTTVQHTYSSTGTYTATVTVTDDKGATGTASVTILVGSSTGKIVKSVSAGWNHTCAVLSDGTVKCWGYNGAGKLGNGTITTSSVPVSVIGITTATSISARYEHSCALLSDGTVKCWGKNDDGRLGNGTITFSTTPVDVSFLTGVTAISAGNYHTCALTSSGGVKCWGSNADGQLGNGTNTGPETCGSGSYTYACSTTPVDVAGLSSGVSAISAGDAHTCALTSSGGVKCWGYNTNSQLGNGTTGPDTCDYRGCSKTPVDVSGLTGVTAISAGAGYTCALTSSGGVKCWGAGNGTTTNSSTPVDVSGLTGVTAISTGTGHTCALTSSGGVKCLGRTAEGQLGNGNWKITSSITPVDVSFLTGVTAISAGDVHTCAVTSSGGVKCWGDNHWGQLGNGTNTGPGTCYMYACSTTPVPVDSSLYTLSPLQKLFYYAKLKFDFFLGWLKG